MVITSLNPELIADGRRLLERLEATGVAVDAALWLIPPDRETWKLLVVLTDPSLRGTGEGYGKVYPALEAIEPFQLQYLNVTLDLPNLPVLESLRQTVPPESHRREMRLTGIVIGRRLVADAYIYRLAPVEGSTKPVA